MFSTNVTIYHHPISQAGWNRCYLSIYLSWPGFGKYHCFLDLVSFRVSNDSCVDAYYFILWDLPGEVLAAPASALYG